MKKFIDIFLIYSIIILISACTLFEAPTGTSELITTYTTDSSNYHYLSCVIKITNNGSKNIYSSTINLKAESTERTYYKTSNSNTTINPGQSIYMTVDFSFEIKDSEKKNSSDEESQESWKKESVMIIDSFFN